MTLIITDKREYINILYRMLNTSLYLETYYITQQYMS